MKEKRNGSETPLLSSQIMNALMTSNVSAINGRNNKSAKIG